MLWILEAHFPQNIENIEPWETTQNSYKKRFVNANFIETLLDLKVRLLLPVVISLRDIWHDLQSETLFIGAEGPPSSTGGD